MYSHMGGQITNFSSLLDHRIIERKEEEKSSIRKSAQGDETTLVQHYLGPED